MLWLALRLPLLPLEIFPNRPPPSAVIVRERILACDAAAAQAGICAGMRLADAWALSPELTVIEHDAARQAQRLAALACWAGGFTSEVSLAPPDALLLEVQGSLRLFGGLDALLARIGDGIAGQGHVAALALAPTPRAALWLADGRHAGVAPAACCTNLPEMREALARLPLSALPLADALVARLAGFGARVLGDVLRLPRAGLARRLGAAFANELAQALGDVPDLRPRFAFPDVFCERLELPARIEDAERLFFAAQRLLGQLCGWLAARGAGVRQCRLRLEHEGRAASDLVLSLTAATRDPARIGHLLRERLTVLERAGLAGPVVALVLEADAAEPLPGREAGLFGDDAAGESVALLIERLQVRLGEEAVHALAAVAEDRPECASRPVAPGSSEAVPARGARPCWLLPRPRALPETGGLPQHGGPLKLLGGPERIESGWWDAGEAGAVGDVRRDYFVALSPRGEWLWIFRSDAGWFLHGVYA